MTEEYSAAGSTRRRPGRRRACCMERWKSTADHSAACAKRRDRVVRVRWSTSSVALTKKKVIMPSAYRPTIPRCHCFLEGSPWMSPSPKSLRSMCCFQSSPATCASWPFGTPALGLALWVVDVASCALWPVPSGGTACSH